MRAGQSVFAVAAATLMFASVVGCARSRAKGRSDTATAEPFVDAAAVPLVVALSAAGDTATFAGESFAIDELTAKVAKADRSEIAFEAPATLGWGRVVTSIDRVRQAGDRPFTLRIAGDPRRRTSALRFPKARAQVPSSAGPGATEVDSFTMLEIHADGSLGAVALGGCFPIRETYRPLTSGRVVDETGAPVPAASVEACSADSWGPLRGCPRRATATTATDGKLEFKSVKEIDSAASAKPHYRIRSSVCACPTAGGAAPISKARNRCGSRFRSDRRRTSLHRKLEAANVDTPRRRRR